MGFQAFNFTRNWITRSVFIIFHGVRYFDRTPSIIFENGLEIFSKMIDRVRSKYRNLWKKNDKNTSRNPISCEIINMLFQVAEALRGVDVGDDISRDGLQVPRSIISVRAYRRGACLFRVAGTQPSIVSYTVSRQESLWESVEKSPTFPKPRCHAGKCVTFWGSPLGLGHDGGFFLNRHFGGDIFGEHLLRTDSANVFSKFGIKMQNSAGILTGDKFTKCSNCKGGPLFAESSFISMSSRYETEILLRQNYYSNWFLSFEVLCLVTFFSCYLLSTENFAVDIYCRLKFKINI